MMEGGGGGYVYLLDYVFVRPVVCDGTREEHVGLADRADAGDVERLVLVEEVLRVECNARRVEQLGMFRSPGLRIRTYVSL